MFLCCLHFTLVIILLIVNCNQRAKSNTKKYFGLTVNCSFNLGRIIQNFILVIKIIGLNHNSAYAYIPSYYGELATWLQNLRHLRGCGPESTLTQKLVSLNAWRGGSDSGLVLSYSLLTMMGDGARVGMGGISLPWIHPLWRIPLFTWWAL